MYAKLKDAAKLDSIKKIGEKDYSKVEVAGVDGKTKIAFIVGQGEITRGGTNDSIGNDGITASGLVKLMRQVKDDASIKGVILRIDSPGGDGIASDDILHEAKLRAQKADGNFHVRPGRVGRIFYRHDRRSGDRLSEYADRIHRRGLRQGESQRAV